MPGRTVIFGLALAALLTGLGCTYRAWYEGFRERQRQQCYESPSQSEIDRCLERVNRETYDAYRKAREQPAGLPAPP